MDENLDENLDETKSVCVIPLDLKYHAYAVEIQKLLQCAGILAEIDDRRHTLNRKVREAYEAQNDFVLFVGAKEEEMRTVTIRTQNKQGEASFVNLVQALNIV